MKNIIRPGHIEINEKCKSCNGTGLYIGMAERDGAAVVCHTCKGTGCHHFVYDYEDFVKREYRHKVKRVYQTNVGICIGEEKGKCRLEDFGGMPYEEWWIGKNFEVGMEDRKYSCPAWWFQSVDYKKKLKWKECIGAGAFSSCSDFPVKNKCWERFDRITIKEANHEKDVGLV